jgi:hypothetical protein
MSSRRGIESVGRTDLHSMEIRDQRPVAGYIRVSRIGGHSGEGYISPDQQRVEIERYAAELGRTIPPDAWGDDQDRSGGNFDRPGWENIIQRIESGELGGEGRPCGVDEALAKRNLRPLSYGQGRCARHPSEDPISRKGHEILDEWLED